MRQSSGSVIARVLQWPKGGTGAIYSLTTGYSTGDNPANSSLGEVSMQRTLGRWAILVIALGTLSTYPAIPGFADDAPAPVPAKN